MNNSYLPGLDEFCDKFCTAVTRSGNEENFTKKWGLDCLADVYNILNNKVQGGYASHRQTILSAPIGGSVLNIGPGMGFCVFLLSELFDPVWVTEPDGENCLLLNSISKHYPAHQGKNADEIVKTLHAGISITDEAVNYWTAKHKLMKKRKLKGSILNFNLEGAGELRDVFHEKVSRIYLHKVLSSFSISNRFEDIISQCALFLKDDGTITWSEPGYIFEDILQADAGNTIENKLEPIFDNNQMNFTMKSYELSNRDKEAAITENWTIIKAGRSMDEKK